MAKSIAVKRNTELVRLAHIASNCWALPRGAAFELFF